MALGANLGDAVAAVRAAFDALARTGGVRLLRTSSLYRSAPHEAHGPDFINAVAEVATTLNAPDLLLALQSIERAAGRERPYRNAPRTLDLDLVLYGDARIDSPLLTVPHPRWRERAFVLWPIAELVPERLPAGWSAVVADQRIERLPVT